MHHRGKPYEDLRNRYANFAAACGQFRLQALGTPSVPSIHKLPDMLITNSITCCLAHARRRPIATLKHANSPRLVIQDTVYTLAPHTEHYCKSRAPHASCTTPPSSSCAMDKGTLLHRRSEWQCCSETPGAHCAGCCSSMRRLVHTLPLLWLCHIHHSARTPQDAAAHTVGRPPARSSPARASSAARRPCARPPRAPGGGRSSGRSRRRPAPCSRRR